jgi:GNAT superfamily N-acetyltransferase
MTLSLKPLTLAEMDQVAVIHRTAFDDRLPWLADLHRPNEDRAFFRDHIFNTCQVWGAFEASEMVGFIAFRDGWIDQCYVLPEWQRRGVGSALVQVAKAASTRLSLWTFQRNFFARRFYEALGFAAVEQTDGRRNEEREPDVLYRWDRATPPSSAQADSSP